MKFTTRVTQVVVLPQGEPIFSEKAFTVTIDDEAGGEFLVVNTNDCDHGQQVGLRIDVNEWPALRNAIDRMVKEVKKHEPKVSPWTD